MRTKLSCLKLGHLAYENGYTAYFTNWSTLSMVNETESNRFQSLLGSVVLSPGVPEMFFPTPHSSKTATNTANLALCASNVEAYVNLCLKRMKEGIVAKGWGCSDNDSGRMSLRSWHLKVEKHWRICMMTKSEAIRDEAAMAAAKVRVAAKLARVSGNL